MTSLTVSSQRITKSHGRSHQLESTRRGGRSAGRGSRSAGRGGRSSNREAGGKAQQYDSGLSETSATDPIQGTELKNNIEEVLKTYKPPIFWKDKDIIKEQLKIWNQKKIEKLIVETNEIELKIKKTPSISVMLITDFVLENCYSANN